jgi:hypothetical protein
VSLAERIAGGLLWRGEQDEQQREEGRGEMHHYLNYFVGVGARTHRVGKKIRAGGRLKADSHPPGSASEALYQKFNFMPN